MMLMRVALKHMADNSVNKGFIINIDQIGLVLTGINRSTMEEKGLSWCRLQTWGRNAR